MATPAQIAANRANALKSTGPRSASGKAASRFNALKHSLDAESLILPGEDPAEYQALADAYRDSHQPQSPDERFHVDALLRADWHKRRLQRVEADLYRTILTESATPNLAAALLADTPATRLLTRIQRQIAAHDRAWYRALRELNRLREQADQDGARALDALLAVPPLPSHLASFPEKPSTPAAPTPKAATPAPPPPPDAPSDPAPRPSRKHSPPPLGNNDVRPLGASALPRA